MSADRWTPEQGWFYGDRTYLVPLAVPAPLIERIGTDKLYITVDIGDPEPSVQALADLLNEPPGA